MEKIFNSSSYKKGLFDKILYLKKVQDYAYENNDLETCGSIERELEEAIELFNLIKGESKWSSSKKM